MNNQSKILLTVQGIEGGTLRPIGKKRVNWSITKKDLDPKYHGKDAFKPIRKGHTYILILRKYLASRLLNSHRMPMTI